MTKTQMALAAVAAVLVLGGIGSALEDEPTEPTAAPAASTPAEPSPEPSLVPEPEPTVKAPEPTETGPEPIDVDVPWGNYAPNVRVVIDDAYAAQDCQTLQQQFDSAFANNDAQRTRTGEGNDDLLRYLDEALKQAGCYE
jgi:hypothetical protein